MTSFRQSVHEYVDPEMRYNQDDLEQYFIDLKMTKAPKKRRNSNNDDLPPANLEEIVAGCAWMRHCRDDAATLPEPEWYAMLTIMSRCENGRELAHEWSEPYPDYDPEETDKKIDHALEPPGGPVTCEYIQTLNPTYCQSCEMCGLIKSPINLGTPDPVEKELEELPDENAASQLVREVIEKVKDMKKKEAAKEIMRPEVVGALAVLQMVSPDEFAYVKAELNGKVNMRDLATAMQPTLQKMTDYRKRQIARRQAKELSQALEGSPLENVPVKVPTNYILRRDGLYTLVTVQNGMYQHEKPLTETPVIVSRRLKDIENGQEKIEIAFIDDNEKWTGIRVKPSSVLNKSAVIGLSDFGLFISSDTAGPMSTYIHAFLRENKHILPTVPTLSRMGWADKTFQSFLPHYGNGVELDVGDSGPVTAYHDSAGTVDEWIEAVRPYREKYMIPRFFLAAAFAAPLIKLTRAHDAFFIHTYGPTGGGKTTSLRLALSVWGHPKELTATFNATKVGMERLAALYTDLPMAIDEKQVLGRNNQEGIETLVYLMSGGRGKLRGNKDGTLQTTSSWTSIVLTTGEEPLSRASSTGGVKRRAIEIYGKPIPDDRMARKLQTIVTRYYGTAGKEFMGRVIDTVAKNRDFFADAYMELNQSLLDLYPDNMGTHCSYVALVCLADLYVSQWLFGLDKQTAEIQAYDLAEFILTRQETQEEIDDGKRALDYLLSYVAQHPKAFPKAVDKLEEKETMIYHGWRSKDGIVILSKVFDEIMDEAGHDPKRILQDWAERNWIKTANEDGKTRYRIKKRSPHFGNNPRVVVVQQTEI